jgi:hypothetical protein
MWWSFICKNLDIVSRFRISISYLDIVSRYRISISYLDNVSRYRIPEPQFWANQEIFVILAWNLGRGKNILFPGRGNSLVSPAVPPPMPRALPLLNHWEIPFGDKVLLVNYFLVDIPWPRKPGERGGGMKPCLWQSLTVTILEFEGAHCITLPS